MTANYSTGSLTDNGLKMSAPVTWCKQHFIDGVRPTLMRHVFSGCGCGLDADGRLPDIDSNDTCQHHAIHEAHDYYECTGCTSEGQCQCDKCECEPCYPHQEEGCEHCGCKCQWSLCSLCIDVGLTAGPCFAHLKIQPPEHYGGAYECTCPPDSHCARCDGDHDTLWCPDQDGAPDHAPCRHPDLMECGWCRQRMRR